MMRVLSPTYKITVTVKDPFKSPNAGNTMTAAQSIVGPGDPPSGHKFFDSLKGKTGCDEALAAVKDALAKAGIEADVWLEQFSHS